MNINFVHNGASHGATYDSAKSGDAKFYQVPIEYSPDGYYIAKWEEGAIEPIPACAISDTLMLCHVRVENADNGTKTLKIIKTIDGATCYAEN